MRQLDVAVRILQDPGACPLQHAGSAAGKSRRVAPGLDALAAGLDTDQADIAIADERIEDADGVAAAAHTGNHRIRQLPALLEDLRACLTADHRLKFAD